MENFDKEIIKAEIQNGLLQVDDTFVIDEFNVSLNSLTRELSVSFKAHTESGEVVEVNKSWD